MDSRSTTVSLKLTRRTRLVAEVGVTGALWSGMLCDLRSPPFPPTLMELDSLLGSMLFIGAEASAQHFRCSATTRRLKVAKASTDESSLRCKATGTSTAEVTFELPVLMLPSLMSL